MNNEIEWEKTYSGSHDSHKNKYPSELIISWVKKNYSNKIELEKRKEYKVLDLGCGWGNNLKFLKEEGFDSFGIDFSKSAVDSLKDEFGENVKTMNFKYLDFDNNTFDFIIDRSSIQHNTKENISIIHNEIFRVLKDGGKFYSIMVKNGDNGFFMELLNEEEVKSSLSNYSKVKIDYLSKTTDGGKMIHENFLIEAIKGL